MAQPETAPVGNGKIGGLQFFVVGLIALLAESYLFQNQNNAFVGTTSMSYGEAQLLLLGWGLLMIIIFGMPRVAREIQSILTYRRQLLPPL